MNKRDESHTLIVGCLVIGLLIIILAIIVTSQILEYKDPKITNEEQKLNFTVTPLSVENIKNGEVIKKTERGRMTYYRMPSETIQIIYHRHHKDKLMNVSENHVKEKFDSTLKKPKASIKIKRGFNLEQLRDPDTVNDYYNHYNVIITYPNHNWKEHHEYKGDHDQLFIVNKPKKDDLKIEE